MKGKSCPCRQFAATPLILPAPQGEAMELGQAWFHSYLPL